MKFYCKTCRGEFKADESTKLPTLTNGEYMIMCPVCTNFEKYEAVYMEPIPDWETPAQYEKRTGKLYPDDGPVWYLYTQLYGKRVWKSDSYETAKWYIENHKSCGKEVVVAMEQRTSPSIELILKLDPALKQYSFQGHEKCSCGKIIVATLTVTGGN